MLKKVTENITSIIRLCRGSLYTFSSVKYLITNISATIKVIEFPNTRVAATLNFSKTVSTIL
ncbi:MAG: hypothetical protein NVSMB45_19210 [Ginsengibacter sp.]